MFFKGIMMKNSKRKVVNYYHLEETKSINDNKEKKGTVLKKIDDKLADTYKLLRKKKSDEIGTVLINDNNYYICAMDKGYSKDSSGKDFAWLISISRLDPTRQVEIGDMKTAKVDERNKPLKTTDTQGLVIETQFLYDPETHVFATFSNAGGVKLNLLKYFLVRYCDVKGIMFAVIPDKDGIKDIDSMVKGGKITYKIAGVSAIQNIKNPNASELKDIEYADQMGGDEMEITISAENNNLKPKSFKDKLKFLFKHSDDLELKKLRAEGINDNGVETPLDLLQHKLKTTGNLEYDNIIMTENAFDFLDTEYGKVYDFIKNKVIQKGN